MQQGQLRIVCPSGHLGYLPCPDANFHRAAQAEPHYYCWNSGSFNPDPFLIGVDSSLSLYDWQKHDLELALLAARRQRVPLLIGSAGDTGTNSRVDLYVECLRHLSQKHNLPPFTLAYFYTEVSKQALNQYSEQALPLSGQDERDAIPEEALEHTDRILAIAGVQPYLRALETGADVIIGGRSCQVSMLAAVALHNRFPAALAYSLGYVLEQCGSAVMPGQALLGAIASDAVRVSLLNSQEQRRSALAAQTSETMPFLPVRQPPPDGMLDLSGCEYRRVDDTTMELRGATFFPAENDLRVRLEGAGKEGERHVGILKVSDAARLEQIERLFEQTLARIAEHFTGKSYQLTYQAYQHHPPLVDSDGLSAASGAYFLLIEGIAETGQLAEELTIMATRVLMSAMPVSENLTAQPEFLILESLLAAPPVYRWTIQQTLPAANPNDFFDLHVVTVG